MVRLRLAEAHLLYLITIMNIRKAVPTDAPAIGKAVAAAIGTDHCLEMANGHTLAEVEQFFADLAERPDSQYSYRNTLIATDSDGATIGVCVAYPGRDLYQMRKAFIEKGKDFFGLDPDNIPDETDASEMYLDSLWVAPDHRGKGIARSLIEATTRRAAEAALPLGLLCDPANDRARRLYLSVGFAPVAPRSFMGIMMDHLVLSR